MADFIELPVTIPSKARRAPLHGLGINDADYIVQPIINGKHLRCPYYSKWSSMLMRCYCKKYQEKNPTYVGCTVSAEWLTFSNFKRWMISQDWRGKVLDKDLIVAGNKIYSPETCIFVSAAINGLFCDSAAIRGKYPQGVSFEVRRSKFVTYCKVGGRQKFISYSETQEEAEMNYLKFKIDLVLGVASESKDKTLNSALLRHCQIMTNRIIYINGED